jgi:hypothetical protein
MRWLPRAAARVSTSRGGFITSGMVLLATLLTSCTSAPGPTTQSAPTSIVSVGPVATGVTLDWAEPVAGLTDGTTVLKVLGPGNITIEHVGVVIDPTSAPVVVAWSGVEPVTGTLADAVSAAPGLDTAQAGETLEGKVQQAAGAVVSSGAFYDIVTLLQVSSGFSQSWTIQDTDVTYRIGSGSSQTLQIPERVQVQ